MYEVSRPEPVEGEPLWWGSWGLYKTKSRPPKRFSGATVISFSFVCALILCSDVGRKSVPELKHLVLENYDLCKKPLGC